MSADYQRVGGWYLFCLPIYDLVGIVVSWCLELFIVGDVEICDELVVVDLGELVSIAIGFILILDELSETGALGGLGKLL